MLTHRDRGWSTVRESMRRERRIGDLLNASYAARLSKRVASDRKDPKWQRAEHDLRQIEQRIRRLDPIDGEFWDQAELLEYWLFERF